MKIQKARVAFHALIRERRSETSKEPSAGVLTHHVHLPRSETNESIGFHRLPSQLHHHRHRRAFLAHLEFDFVH